MELDEVEYWQDTLEDPSWRTIQPNPDDYNVDYKVTIDAWELNGEILPTYPGQGHYESEEELNRVYNELVGINTTEYSYLLVVYGTTVKMTTDGGPTDGTTGVFVYDALTDDHGQIYIDGENRTEAYINPEHTRSQHQQIQRTDGTTESVESDGVTTLSTTMSGDMTTQFFLPPLPFMTVEDQTELEDQGWTATLRMLTSEYKLQRDTVASDISDIKKDGVDCYVTWFESEWGFDFVRFDCYEAKLGIDLDPQDEDGETIPQEILEASSSESSSPTARSISQQYVHPDLSPDGKGCARGVLNPDGSPWDNKLVDTVTAEECHIPGVFD